LFDFNNVESKPHQPVTNVFCGGVDWQVSDHRLYGFFSLGVEGKEGVVISFEVRFYG
jgi:hypothetical protein